MSSPFRWLGLSLIGSLGFCFAESRGEDWPQWLGTKRDSIWREDKIAREIPAEGFPVLWRTPVQLGYAGPAVANGKIYVPDRVQLEKPAEDKEKGTIGKERLLCLNEADGKVLWTHEYDCRYVISYPFGPRVTPYVEGDRVYHLGAMGDLVCLNAESGEVIWKKQLREAYTAPIPAWGYAAHPLFVGDLMIMLVGGEGSAVVALNKTTGEEVWKNLTAEEIGYAPPVLFPHASGDQVIIWHDTEVHGLDIRSGEKKWTIPFPDKKPVMRPVVTIATPRVVDSKIFISDFYNGSAMIEVDASGTSAKILWRAAKEEQEHREGLNALMTTPFLTDGLIFGMSGDGELRCLQQGTGVLNWRDLKPTGGDRPVYFATSFIVKNDDRYILFNDQGELMISELLADKYVEHGRMKLLEPSGFARGRNVVWSHPAFANRHIYVRNDKEIICVDLEKK